MNTEPLSALVPRELTELRYRPLGAILLIAGVSSIAEAQTAPAARSSCSLPHASGVAAQQITSMQRQRSYRLFVPAGYDGRTPLPLVLDLHPSGGTSDGQARTSGFETLAALENFAVASPQAENGRWNVPVQDSRADDVAYIMASLLACTLNSRITAFAPVASLRWPAPCSGRPIPVLTFHGLADTQNPYAGHVEGRNGEWIESILDALAGWAQHNGCRPGVIMEVTSSRSAPSNDGGSPLDASAGIAFPVGDFQDSRRFLDGFRQAKR